MSVVTMATKVMSPSSYSFEHRLGSGGDFNTCGQQANSPYHRATTTNTAAAVAAAAAEAHLKSTSVSSCSGAFDPDDQDEQDKRNKLIQAATNRLRQKRLEIRLQAMMAQIVEIQCQLDIIKLDTSTSLQLLPSSDISESQLSHFEKRLAHHRADLQRIFQSSSKREEPSAPIKPKETKASSTISSLLSNILCSKSNSHNKGNGVMMSEEDSDYSILGGSLHHHQKRRNRRHFQQHGSTQNNVINTSSPPATTITTTASSVSSDETEDNGSIRSGSTETTSSVCWSSFDRTSDSNSILVQPLHQEVTTNARNRHELLVLHSIPPSSISAASETSSNAAVDRSALDDVLSFLNDIELGSHDNDRLVDDIYKLLEQEYRISKLPTVVELSTTLPVFHLLQRLLNKGMKWIKFAIVMILAIIINLRKGPKSFL